MKMKIKYSCLVLLLCFVSLGLKAQNITVKGVVTDQSNQPVIGATITAEGTKNTAITDLDGNYTIQAPANGTLVINYIGMKPFAQKIAGRNLINVTLTDDVNQLQDVVVVGYGTQKRGSLTGSVAAVKGDEMIRTKNENPQNMLTGRVAVCACGRRVLSRVPTITTSMCVAWAHRWSSSTAYPAI